MTFSPLAVILLLISSLCHASVGQTFYVSPDGSDQNSGASWGKAWKTLKKAGRSATLGDTVIIRKAATPYHYLEVHRSGLEKSPITFRGEDPADPPVISGAVTPTAWTKSGHTSVWSTEEHQPGFVVEDDRPLPRASSPECLDGNWFWEKKRLFYKPTFGAPSEHNIRISTPAGIVIRNKSWIVIENITCVLGSGACVSIKAGHHNKVRNVHAKWFWRGINIADGAHYNLVENCLVEENREGIYILRGSSWNTIRNCKAIRNGRYPIWSKGDRAGIAIGEHGPNIGNTVELSEIAFNGGPDSDPGLIAYDAPKTTFRNNFIHDNYGSGVFVTINSHESLVIDNRVERNGWEAAKVKQKGIAGLSVRWGSRNTAVINNTVRNNHVSSDSRWPGKGIGPKGGLDVQALHQHDMSGIVIRNNRVTGTVGGPDIFISPEADFPLLNIEPKP